MINASKWCIVIRPNRIMTTTTKTLLAISLGGFALGAFTNVLWGIGTPIGAIFFGLFLISKLLEKEVAKFDEEQRLRRPVIVPGSSSALPATHHEEEPQRIAA